MKILFKSNEKTIRDAAIKWYHDLMFSGEITYSFTLPECAKGFELPHDGTETICATMEKQGHTYIIFHHYEYGIIIARMINNKACVN